LNKNQSKNEHQPLTLKSSPNKEELIEFETKYRRLRNERNKLLRKKKGIEINAKREQMSNELKSLRKIMKKLRRKHHSKPQFRHNQPLSESSSKHKKKNKTV